MNERATLPPGVVQSTIGEWSATYGRTTLNTLWLTHLRGRLVVLQIAHRWKTRICAPCPTSKEGAASIWQNSIHVSFVIAPNIVLMSNVAISPRTFSAKECKGIYIRFTNGSTKWVHRLMELCQITIQKMLPWRRCNPRKSIYSPLFEANPSSMQMWTITSKCSNHFEVKCSIGYQC